MISKTSFFYRAIECFILDISKIAPNTKAHAAVRWLTEYIVEAINKIPGKKKNFYYLFSSMRAIWKYFPSLHSIRFIRLVLNGYGML